MFRGLPKYKMITFLGFHSDEVRIGGILPVWLPLEDQMFHVK
jgi:hypothetical protein